MRILVVQETDWLQRGPHQQHHLFERLSARGHQVAVMDFEILYTPWPRAPLVARKREWHDIARVVPAARVRVLRPGTLRIPGIARLVSLATFHTALTELVADFRPDVIVDYALSTGLPALRVARRHHVPFLLHVIDSLHTLVPHKPVQLIARAVEKRLLRAADRTLYINHELQDYGIDLGARPETASTIRTGVDLKRFRPDHDAVAVRRAWGLCAEDVALVFIGWLYEFAGVDAIMRVLPELPPHVKLLVVGVGEAEARLKALRESLDLDKRVIFTGRQPYDTMPQFMAAADVCLLYSELNQVTRHIVPIKLYEYMASGRPVLASELPGVRREVPPGNGVLYAPHGKLLSTLQRLLDAQTRLAEGWRARAFAEANCDWERLTDEFERLLEDTLLSSSARPTLR